MAEWRNADADSGTPCFVSQDSHDAWAPLALGRFGTNHRHDESRRHVPRRRVSQPIRGWCLHVETKRTEGADVTNDARVPKARVPKARVPQAKITGLYGSLLKMMMRKMLGRVPESAEVMWHNPALFKDMMGFGRKVEKWKRLDPNLASFAAMATAGLVGCSLCLDLQYFMAHNKRLDEVKAREVPRWRESKVFTPLERNVMEYAEAMSRTPLTVTDEMSAALLEELGAAALLELTARIGLMNFSARNNVALGLHSEEYSAACGLRPLATPSADVVFST